VTALRALAVGVGALIVLADLFDLVKSLVVPRPHVRGPVSSLISGGRRVLHLAAGTVRGFAARDRFLAIGEPVLMLLRLFVWLGVGLSGFALLIWGVGTSDLGHAFIESGSSIFTLGFASERAAVPSVVVFIAAAFGLVVVALQIAYLPALYDAFNRRETLVTMLESRAGSPAWGPELLARHYLVGIEGNLPAFYGDWERWSADVAESHTTYPILLYLRSPHPTNSWVVGLVAVLDSAALYLALCPSRAPAEARLCVRMGFTALRDIARVVRIPYDPDPMPDSPISISRQAFSEAVDRLVRAGVPIERTEDEAWPHFVGWRINYESIAVALADIVHAPAALWSGERSQRDDAPVAPVRPVDRRPDQPEGRTAERT